MWNVEKLRIKISEAVVGVSSKIQPIQNTNSKG